MAVAICHSCVPIYLTAVSFSNLVSLRLEEGSIGCKLETLHVSSTVPPTWKVILLIAHYNTQLPVDSVLMNFDRLSYDKDTKDTL